MQKLVVIQIKSNTDTVQEYLKEDLKDGWRIVSVTSAGAGNEFYSSFLVTVVLERDAE